MVRYLRLENIKGFLYLIYKWKPDHIFFQYKDASYIEKNTCILYRDIHSIDILSYKGLIKYDEYYASKLGQVINDEKTHFIEPTDALYDFSSNLFEEILPQLKILGIEENYDCHCLNDYVFFRSNKIFPMFTEDEYEGFIKEAINKQILYLTESI